MLLLGSLCLLGLGACLHAQPEGLAAVPTAAAAVAANPVADGGACRLLPDVEGRAAARL